MKTQKIAIAAILLLVTFTTYSQDPVELKCRTGLNKPIIQNGFTRDSILVILGTGIKIDDVNLRIDTIYHSWVSELSIYLRKSDRGVKVFNRTGGSSDNFIRTVLNDSAANIIDSAFGPFTGTFRPHTPLSIFNGFFDPNGYWVLSITDTAGGDTGLLMAWCISIQYSEYLGGIQTVEIPNTYRLYQNYPNPFNPVSKIKYGVPKNGYVRLAVYDEIGRLVAILQDGEKQSNTYEAEFDATNLPSGVYYYRLEAEGFVDTKKMVLVK